MSCKDKYFQMCHEHFLYSVHVCIISLEIIIGKNLAVYLCKTVLAPDASLPPDCSRK